MNSVRYISPNGSGSGYSLEDSASIYKLNNLISSLPPGGEVWISSGEYSVVKPIDITSGSSSKAITIKGTPSESNTSVVLVGSRDSIWSPGKKDGDSVFRIFSSNLNFVNLKFKNVGNAFRIASDIKGLTIEQIEATNVRRFLENYVSGNNKTATVKDLTVNDVKVFGFSKGVIRLKYDSQNIIIHDVYGDSLNQIGDDFPIGIHLEDTVHNVVHTRVVMKNCTQQRGPTEYWNGDGFATESGTYNIRYENTTSSGNTDAGYDLKSKGTVLINAKASKNKRNFRVWGSSVLADVISENPKSYGGIGKPSHINVLKGGDVYILRGQFTNESILDVEQGGLVNVV